MTIKPNARRKCEYPNCNKAGRNKGYYKGKTRYDKHCEMHHRTREPFYKQKQSIDNSKCERCGWDKAPCDRHRINPSEGYKRDNVLVLCPNCHRVETLTLTPLAVGVGGRI